MKNKMIKLGVILTVLAFVTSPYTSVDEHKNVKVTDKLVKGDTNLIYTDKTTFKLQDSWAYFRFNSSDVYGKIQVGETYDIKAYGWRFGLFSWYENVISFDKPLTTSK